MIQTLTNTNYQQLNKILLGFDALFFLVFDGVVFALSVNVIKVQLHFDVILGLIQVKF